jgi:DNA-directed RNA polymerase subunit RPC12/RpoP
MKTWKCPYCKKETVTLRQKAFLAVFGAVRCKYCGMKIMEATRSVAMGWVILPFIVWLFVNSYFHLESWSMLLQMIFMLLIFLSSFLASVFLVDVATPD